MPGFVSYICTITYKDHMKKFFVFIFALLASSPLCAMEHSKGFVWNEEIDVFAQQLTRVTHSQVRRMELVASVFGELSKDLADYPLKKYERAIRAHVQNHLQTFNPQCDLFLSELCIKHAEWMPFVALFHKYNSAINNHIDI